MKATLVIMAAGIGSRYGGDKQIDGVGPNNEMLMEYAVFDAVRAGFGRIVFIVKPEHLELVKKLCGAALELRTAISGEKLEVCYAFQDMAAARAQYDIPEDRIKPLGTVHAVLCARDVIDGPFAVINADDYYGIDAYKTLYKGIMALEETGEALMVGYRLKNTVSRSGSVTRGICSAEKGILSSVTETYGVTAGEDGSLWSVTEEGRRPLDPEALVSMNMWGFMPGIFEDMAGYFEKFMEEKGREDAKAECLLPIMVDDLIKRGALTVFVKDTRDAWFGMTYPEDKAIVRRRLSELHSREKYPVRLG